MSVAQRLDPETEVRLRRSLAELATKIGFRAEQHVRDVLDAAKRAMERRCRDGLTDYVADLASGKESPEPWIEEVVVQETYFFRDLEQLDWISRAVLAPLVHARGLSPAFRIWSAGCATGEEVHTLGAMIHGLGLVGSATVVGTDISPSAIRRARLAEYGPFALRGSHGDRMRPYLERTGERYRVRADVRALSEFRHGNLAAESDASDPAPGTVGLVVCRNVLLYFTEEAVAATAARIARAMVPGGVLVTASADPPIAGLPGWSRVPSIVGAYERLDLAAEPPHVAYGSVAPRHDAAPPRSASFQHGPVAESSASAPHVASSPSSSPRSSPPGPLVPEAAAVADALSVAAHHDRALSLLEAGELLEALEAARRVTYLAPDLVMAHFTLAHVALREGSLGIARRSYRAAERLALQAPPDDELPLGGGLRAADVARSSQRQLERLGAAR